MRTIIDIPDENAIALDILRAKTRMSRNALINKAITEYLRKIDVTQKSATNYDDIESLFGLTKQKTDAFEGLDGLSYQEKMRGEWADLEYETSPQTPARFLHDSILKPYDLPPLNPQKTIDKK